MILRNVSVLDRVVNYERIVGMTGGQKWTKQNGLLVRRFKCLDGLIGIGLDARIGVYSGIKSEYRDCLNEPQATNTCDQFAMSAHDTSRHAFLSGDMPTGPTRLD